MEYVGETWGIWGCLGDMDDIRVILEGYVGFWGAMGNF